MSHIDVGPLARYNSLTDAHLAGYFSGLRIKNHLRKSGLVTRHGEIVSETRLRVNNARHEHKCHVRELLAQAIVHRTLDAERSRQVAVRRKLEEIAKIELVRRVQAELGRKGDEAILPYLTPREAKRSRPSSVPAGRTRHAMRPISAPVTKSRSRKRSTSDRSDPKNTSSPGQVKSSFPPNEGDGKRKGQGRVTSSKYPKDQIDDRHLYALDQHALREYLTRVRALATSPYQSPQLPIDREPTPPAGRPRSPDARTQHNRGHLQKTLEQRKASKTNKGSLMLHRQEPAMRHQDRVQTMCEVTMHYFGGRLRLDYERFDPLDEVAIEQQHCGGNTLIVFRGKVTAGTDFQFVSRRHRGYPFSLTLYVNSSLVGRVSACCEYKHGPGARLGGMLGKFGVVGVSGAAPCYRCHVKQEMAAKDQQKQTTLRQMKRMVSGEGSKVAVTEEEDTEVVATETTQQCQSSRSDDVHVMGMSDNIETRRETGRSANGVEVAVEEEEEEEEVKVQDDKYDYSDEDFEADDAADKETSGSEDTTNGKVDEADSKEGMDGQREADRESTAVGQQEYAADSESDKASGENKSTISRAHERSPLADSRIQDNVTSSKKADHVTPPPPLPPRQQAVEVAPQHAKPQSTVQGQVQQESVPLSRAIRDEMVGPERESSDEEGETVAEIVNRDDHITQESVPLSRAIRDEVVEPERESSDEEDGETVAEIEVNGEDNIKQDEPNKADDESSSSSLDSTRSSSSSDSSDSETDSENETERKTPHEHTPACDETESDNLAGGHDPDNVSSGVVDRRPRPMSSTRRHEGSIKPLIQGQREIALLGVTLNRQQVHELASELKASDTCESLLLTACGLDADRLTILADALASRQSGQLRMLNVNSNRLEPDCVPAILSMVRASPHLERLLLHDNPFGDEGCNKLLDGLRSLHEKRVSQRHQAAIVSAANSVVADVMADVVGSDYLPENDPESKEDGSYARENGLFLEQLDLADVGMATMGVEALGRLLNKEDIHISSLGLGGNKDVMQTSNWSPVADALAHNHGNVVTLSLERNALGDAGIAVIGAAIASNTTMQMIDLESNDIGETGAVSLLTAMQVNSSLADVTLAPGNDEISIKTANAIKQLASVNASGC